ncbi:MAG: TFIIB-type zinc finger domain-containing protein [Eubacteriales bacterium]
MKPLTCEMCNSTDMLKNDGLFVCQSCGTKYSLEEAKKMMISGTVVVDSTASIDNYYKLATNAYESDNKKESELYCNKIIEIAPEHYKAWLLKGMSAGWQSTLGNLRIDECVNCFTNALNHAPDEEKDTLGKEIASEIKSLSVALIQLCCNNYIENPTVDNSTAIWNNIDKTNQFSLSLLVKCSVSSDYCETELMELIYSSAMSAWSSTILRDYQSDEHPSRYVWDTFKQRTISLMALLEVLIKVSADSAIKKKSYQLLITCNLKMMLSKSWTRGYMGEFITDLQPAPSAILEMRNSIRTYQEKIKEIDPNYEIPQTTGCYVATAVYGSYDCPEVWVLRRFRDNILGKSLLGRGFVRFYYATSPTLVKWFGESEVFKNYTKPKLDFLVAHLEEKGISNLPYDD